MKLVFAKQVDSTLKNYPNPLILDSEEPAIR